MVFPQAFEQGSAERLLGKDLRGAAITASTPGRPSSDEYHDRSKPARCDLPCRLNPPDPWHANVHQDQVWLKTLGPPNALFTRARAPNPLKPRRGVDHRVGGVLERELVVDDQDPDRRDDRPQGDHCAMLTAARLSVHSTRMCKWREPAGLPAPLSGSLVALRCRALGGFRDAGCRAVLGGGWRAGVSGAGASMRAVRTNRRVVRPRLCS